MVMLIVSVMVFAATFLLYYVLSPVAADQSVKYVRKKASWSNEQLNLMFMDIPKRRLMLVVGLSPVLGGLIGYLLMPEPLMMGLGTGVAAGLLLPQVGIKFIAARRKKMFQKQLVDGLMVLSSSLKAGLSMLQALEVLVEEMPPPVSQEFGLVLKETKMGVSLNEALERLKVRMPSDDLTLIVIAIVVARETGGDVTEVFSKLIETIRERQKFKERVKTLTVIPRVQAMIMACLPIGFAIFANQMSPGYFKPFFENEIGRMLIMAAVAIYFVSLALMLLFSKIKV